MGLAVLGATLETAALAASDLSATAHAYGAVVLTLWGIELAHIAIAIAMGLFALQRSGADRHVPAVAALFWHYTVLQWGAGFALVHLFPLVAA